MRKEVVLNRVASVSAVSVSFLLLLLACGSDAGGPGAPPPGGSAASLEVGASCRDDLDCARRCIRDDDHYPGGMCTLSCRDDRDCPVGAACIDDKDGICAVTCRTHADCDSFARGYACDDRERKGADGEAFVCRRP